MCRSRRARWNTRSNSGLDARTSAVAASHAASARAGPRCSAAAEGGGLAAVVPHGRPLVDRVAAHDALAEEAERVARRHHAPAAAQRAGREVVVRAERAVGAARERDRGHAVHAQRVGVEEAAVVEVEAVAVRALEGHVAAVRRDQEQAAGLEDDALGRLPDLGGVRVRQDLLAPPVRRRSDHWAAGVQGQGHRHGGCKHTTLMVKRPSPWNLGGLTVRELARRVYNEIWADEVLDRGAALAYYFIFALFP